ncbi:MAG: phosphoribosylglycinamide formyltransferase [Pseudomonadota bacterium]|nr:phosphoribosylglycinamide formyltransferase [Pseudomonadota bacterium]
MLKVGILISGRGSNMQALIDAARTPGYPARIECVLSNNAEAPGLARARDAGIAVYVVNNRDFPNRDAFETAMEEKLNAHGVQLLCLAGFMRLLTPAFTERWRDRLVNIHPSLLPAFPGLDPHKKALAYGVRFAGCTVHFVRPETDSGPIIMQATVPVLPEDTEETLAARVLKAEHIAYPETVRFIAEGRVNVYEGRVLITGAQVPPETVINPIENAALARLKPA